MSAAVPGAHPDEEILSGYVDGELTAEEHAEVHAHLETCAECSDVVAGERRIQGYLRALPLVEPPFGLFERLLLEGLPPGRRPGWLRLGILNLVVSAAALILVIGLASGGRPTTDVGAADVITRSASILPGLDLLQGRKATPAEAESAASYGVPTNLAGTYELAGFEMVDGVPQAVFSNGEQTLSVFVVPGRLDWRRLPSPRQVQVNGSPAWQVRVDDADVVLVQRGDAVVVIAGPPSSTDPALATEIDPELPDRDGIGDRIEAAGRRLLETFGLRG